MRSGVRWERSGKMLTREKGIECLYIRFCETNKNLCFRCLKHPFIRHHAEDILGSAVLGMLTGS